MSSNGRRLSRAAELAAADSKTPEPKTPRRMSSGSHHGTPLAPVQEGSERVKVVVRVRPNTEQETVSGLQISNGNKTVVLPRKNDNVVQTDFQFDQVLGTSANQLDVYKAAVEPIVLDVLKGYNGTIMAYGQTGAGKTYTLSSISTADNIGMMPRAASHIFSEINGDVSHIYNVVMSYAQIYREQILDLIKPDNGKLEIREGPNGVFIQGIEEQPVRSVKDCLSLMQQGDQNRKTALTAMNAHSSRSHAIVMLTVVKRQRKALQSTAISVNEEVKVGKLFIVDLAGSERLKKSMSTGVRADEAKAINLSLTNLGICIKSRADRTSKHTPFRDSKLTRLLQESLGGNAKTSLVVAIADAAEHLDETLQSIQFGQRAMRVQTKAKINENLGSELLNADLLKRLSSMDIAATCVVDANLLAKEEQLREIQEALTDERMKAQRAMEDLKAANMSELKQSEQELIAAQAKLTEQEQQALRHQEELSILREEKAAMEQRGLQESQTLNDRLRAAESDLHILQATASQEASQLRSQISQLQARLEEEATAAENSANRANQAVRLAADRAKEVEDLAAQMAKLTADSKAEISRLRLAGEQKEALLEEQRLHALEESDQLRAEASAEAAENEQLKREVARLQEELATAQRDSARQAKQAQAALLQSTADANSKYAQLQADSQYNIEKVETELAATKRDLVLCQQQLTKAHEEAGAAHQHAADATNESVLKVESLMKEHHQRLEELKTSHESAVSALNTHAQEKAEELQTAIDQKTTIEASLRQDLADIHASSSKRIKEMQRTIEAQHLEMTNKLEHSEQRSALAMSKLGNAHKAELEEIMRTASEKAMSQQQLYEEQIASLQETQAAESQAHAQNLAEQSQKYEEELRAQEERLNQESKGITDLREKLDKAEGATQELDHLYKAKTAEIQDYRHTTGIKLASRDVKIKALSEETEKLQQVAEFVLKKHRQTQAALVIQKAFRMRQYGMLLSERNKGAQDLAVMMRHKHSLEGQKADLEAAAFHQQLTTGINLFGNTMTMLEEALLSVKISFLADTKSKTSLAQLQGRTPSMSPLGGLGAKGVHYTPSPLGRMDSFASDASGRSSTGGPLGNGFSISAFHPRRDSSTPRTGNQNGTPRTARQMSMQRPVTPNT